LGLKSQQQIKNNKNTNPQILNQNPKETLEKTLSKKPDYIKHNKKIKIKLKEYKGENNGWLITEKEKDLEETLNQNKFRNIITTGNKQLIKKKFFIYKRIWRKNSRNE